MLSYFHISVILIVIVRGVKTWPDSMSQSNLKWSENNWVRYESIFFDPSKFGSDIDRSDPTH
jgi:hypothetical protein